MIRAPIAFACACLLAATSAFAGDKPGKGNGHGNPGGSAHGGASGGPPSDVRIEFNDIDQRAVAQYYGPLIEAGKCPPGLAKKQNGCQPPGQAKKWQVGRPLPRDVIFYAVPSALLVRLPPPPQGQKYVRVAADILLIAAGTGLVLGAIEDLGRVQ